MTSDRSDASALLAVLTGAAYLSAAGMLLEFGFNKPSRMGLDFGHFLLLVSAGAVAVVVGSVLALATRRFGWLWALWLSVPTAFVLTLAGGRLWSPPPGPAHPVEVEDELVLPAAGREDRRS